MYICAKLHLVIYMYMYYNSQCQEATGHTTKAAARKETSLREKVQAPGAANNKL